MIDLKRNLFKIDVRAQKDEEKVFMRTACVERHAKRMKKLLFSENQIHNDKINQSSTL